MKPPYYHTLIEILNRKDRNGLPTPTEVEAETVRRLCLESKQNGPHNRGKWADFVLRNPSDKAARYMREYVI